MIARCAAPDPGTVVRFATTKPDRARAVRKQPGVRTAPWHIDIRLPLTS